MRWKYLFLWSLLLGVHTQGQACTGAFLKAQDGSVVNGRTLEFGRKLDCSLVMIPREYPFRGTTPWGEGLSYQSKYAVLGTMAFQELAVLDGLNEAGLCVATFYFPEYAQYAAITRDVQKQALSPVDFPNWLLTQFATLEEIQKALSQVVIVPTRLKNWGVDAPPFHYVIYDRNGGCLVIEPREGKLVVSSNPLGVLTNAPTFDWHMTHLRSYINLRAVNAAPLTIEGLQLTPFGQGSGMVGLPGDFTPPSRFVRAAIFSYTALKPRTASEAVLQLFHLLNQFDIPVGMIRDVVGGKTVVDYTLATTVKDPEALKYYLKTYEDQTLCVVDLHLFDWNGKEVKRLTFPEKQKILDLSKKFR